MKAMLLALVLVVSGCAARVAQIAAAPVLDQPALVLPAVPLPSADGHGPAKKAARGVRALSQLEVDLLAAYIDHKWPRRPIEDRPAYYLSLAEDLDPDSASLERLEARGFTAVQGSKYREGRGVIISIGIVAVAGDVATLDARWHGGPFSGEAGRYHLRQSAGTWVVERAEYELIE